MNFGSRNQTYRGTIHRDRDRRRPSVGLFIWILGSGVEESGSEMTHIHESTKTVTKTEDVKKMGKEQNLDIHLRESVNHVKVSLSCTYGPMITPRSVLVEDEGRSAAKVE
ncbi:Hypothetical predicted protein [Xyrichtys novacula]|nr:Hypothetical predicted protein [Xyrichtys novacula]